MMGNSRAAKLVVLAGGGMLLFSLIGGLAMRPKVLPGQDLPVVTVPGHIIFHSNMRPRPTDDPFPSFRGHLYLVRNGQLEYLAPGEEPRWSPDGRLIACGYPVKVYKIPETGKPFLYNVGIAIIDPAAPKAQPLIVFDGYPDGWAWLPDGKRIVFFGTKWIGPNELEKQSTLYLFDVTQKKVEREIVRFSNENKLLGIDLAPNGKDLLIWGILPQFGPEQNIYLMDITNPSKLEKLVHGASRPRWSPDGTKITYDTNYLHGEKVNSYDEIWVMDVPTKTVTRITNNNWQDSQPTWSPDGKRLCFVSYRHQLRVDGAELFVINLDGTGEARVTPIHENPEYKRSRFGRWATDGAPDWHEE